MNLMSNASPSYTPLSNRCGPPGDTTITTFNLYDLFEVVQTPSGPSSPQALSTKIAKLVLALRHELLLPDILVVQEVESERLLQKVADAVNEAAGTAYRAVSPPCSDRRGIQVGLLWDEQRVELIRAFQLSSPAVSAAFGPQSPSPGREPLAGRFRLKGQELTIVANHFKSDYTGDAEGSEQERLLQASLAQRRAQARVVRDFANTLLQADGDTLLVVAGDFNQTPPTPPKPVDAGNPLAILSGGPHETPLTNLLLSRPDPNNYTFSCDGQPIILDHILISPALLKQFTAVDVLHFNVAYPDIYQTDPSTSCRVSDHDPLEARFTFNDLKP
jgi:predicted extracellular nuclease